MKARCPHGSPWHVECWPCADELIEEHEAKIVEMFHYAYDGAPFFSSHPPISTMETSFYESKPLTLDSFRSMLADVRKGLFG